MVGFAIGTPLEHIPGGAASGLEIQQERASLAPENACKLAHRHEPTRKLVMKGSAVRIRASALSVTSDFSSGAGAEVPSRTAHGGRKWWPSTVRDVLIRSSRLASVELSEARA